MTLHLRAFVAVCARAPFQSFTPRLHARLRRRPDHGRDSVRYAEYVRIAPPSIAAHGGRYLVRGGACEILEGSWLPPRLAKMLRRQSASTEMLLIEGSAG